MYVGLGACEKTKLPASVWLLGSKAQTTKPWQAVVKQSLPNTSPSMLNELTRYSTPGSFVVGVIVSTGWIVSRKMVVLLTVVADNPTNGVAVTDLPCSMRCLSANSTSAKSKLPVVKSNMLPEKATTSLLKPNSV